MTAAVQKSSEGNGTSAVSNGYHPALPRRTFRLGEEDSPAFRLGDDVRAPAARKYDSSYDVISHFDTMNPAGGSIFEVMEGSSPSDQGDSPVAPSPPKDEGADVVGDVEGDQKSRVLDFVEVAAQHVASHLRLLAQEYVRDAAGFQSSSGQERRLQFRQNTASSVSTFLTDALPMGLGTADFSDHPSLRSGSSSSMYAPSPSTSLRTLSQRGKVSPMDPLMEESHMKSPPTVMATFQGDDSHLNVTAQPSKGASKRSVGGPEMSNLVSVDSCVSDYDSPTHPWHYERLPEWITKSLRKGRSEDSRHRPTWQRRLSSLVFGDPVNLPVTSVVQRIRRHKIKRQHKRHMDKLWACIIFLNAVFVSWELQYFVTREEPPSAVTFISAGFALAFTVELFHRWKAMQFKLRTFLFGHDSWWNIVDFVVVCVLWLEVSARLLWGDLPSWVLGNVSLIRIVRFFELMGQVSNRIGWLREIRVLSRVLRVAVRSWLWVLVFTSALMYFCSVALAFGTYPLCHEEKDVRNRDLLCHHFGDVGRTFASFYKATFGGILWGELVEALDGAPMLYQIGLVVSVIFCVIILANLTTGVLVEVHAEGKRQDMECMMAEEQRNTKAFVQVMQDIFEEIDHNRSGAVSKEELELALDDPHMNALLKCHKLEIHDAHLLFDLLDTDKSDSIDVEHFIAGCLKMKGNAQAIDVVRVQMQMDHLQKQLKMLVDGQYGEGTTGSFAKPSTAMDKLQVLRSPSKPSKEVDPAVEIYKIDEDSRSSEHGRDLEVARREETLNANELQLQLVSKASSQLSLLMVAWSGVRISRTEDRAMLLHELRLLRNHVKLNCSTWVDETSGSSIKVQHCNMYQVNYNWIMPLTLPDGLLLSGLDLTETLPVGSFLFQEAQEDCVAPRAVGEVLGVNPDGKVAKRFPEEQDVKTKTKKKKKKKKKKKVRVRVIRGQFTSRRGGEEAEVKFDGKSLGSLSRLESQTTVSYKELVSRKPRKPDWYCCHWWGESLLSFLACVEEHCKLRKGGIESAYWICAFANSQHDLGMELTDDPETSSFQRALSSAQGVFLVLDEEATPFGRIWCDYELYKTVLDSSKSLDIATITKSGHKRLPQILAELPGESAIRKTQREANFPVGVLAKGIAVRLEEGSATVALDKDRILQVMKTLRSNEFNAIGGEPSSLSDNLDTVNQTLHAYFAWAAWPQALKKGMVRKFHSIDLPRVTSQEGGRRELSLSLAHFEEVNDSAIADIVRGLPSGLHELNLSFEGCHHVTDRGLQHLAKALRRGSQLKRLRLDFLGCKHISDVGLEALANSLPQGLSVLRLDFAKCPSVGYAGVVHLAQNLPSCLREFTCTLQGTLVNQDFFSADALQQAVRGMPTEQLTKATRAPPVIGR